jgi:uncharacterized protein
MKLLLTRKQEHITASWAGGTTTQLAIYPPAATLQERNFLFRISTAQVESETSTFTRLQGFTRQIMVLEGTLELDHKGHHSIRLEPFGTDSFEGEWETTSRGRVTDFNLMTMRDMPGKLSHEILTAGTLSSIQLGTSWNVAGLYILKGSPEIQFEEKERRPEEGDFLLMFSEGGGEYIKIQTVEECEVIWVLLHLEAKDHQE